MKLPNKGLGSAPSGLSVTMIIDAIKSNGGSIDMETLYCIVGGKIPAESAMRRYRGSNSCEDFFDALDNKKRMLLRSFVNSSFKYRRNDRRVQIDESQTLHLLPESQNVRLNAHRLSAHPISLYVQRLCDGRVECYRVALLGSIVHKITSMHKSQDAFFENGILSFNATKIAVDGHELRMSIPKRIGDQLNITRSCGCELIDIVDGRVRCRPVVE